MAKQTITRLIDDLDQGDADETVTFGLDGVQYEIDLSVKHADALREALGRFVSAGRKISKVAGSKAPKVAPVGSRSTSRDHREETKAVRTWYRDNWRTAGLPEPNKDASGQYSTYGRIPQSIMDAYRARGQETPPADPPPAEVNGKKVPAGTQPAKPDKSQMDKMREWYHRNWAPAGLEKPKSLTGKPPQEAQDAYHRYGGVRVPPAGKKPAAKKAAKKAPAKTHTPEFQAPEAPKATNGKVTKAEFVEVYKQTGGDVDAIMDALPSLTRSAVYSRTAAAKRENLISK